jgi:hypothetical protein
LVCKSNIFFGYSAATNTNLLLEPTTPENGHSFRKMEKRILHNLLKQLKMKRIPFGTVHEKKIAKQPIP